MYRDIENLKLQCVGMCYSNLEISQIEMFDAQASINFNQVREFS